MKHVLAGILTSTALIFSFSGNAMVLKDPGSPLSVEELSQIRGGFYFSSRRFISIGISVSSTINGRRILNSHIADLLIRNGRLEIKQNLEITGSQIVNVIQHGLGNYFGNKPSQPATIKVEDKPASPAPSQPVVAESGSSITSVDVAQIDAPEAKVPEAEAPDITVPPIENIEIPEVKATVTVEVPEINVDPLPETTPPEPAPIVTTELAVTEPEMPETNVDPLPEPTPSEPVPIVTTELAVTEPEVPETNVVPAEQPSPPVVTELATTKPTEPETNTVTAPEPLPEVAETATTGNEIAKVDEAPVTPVAPVTSVAPAEDPSPVVVSEVAATEPEVEEPMDIPQLAPILSEIPSGDAIATIIQNTIGDSVIDISTIVDIDAPTQSILDNMQFRSRLEHALEISHQ